VRVRTRIPKRGNGSAERKPSQAVAAWFRPMQQSTLQEILGVEEEIRERLNAEREKASQWLEDARCQIQAEHSAETERLQGSSSQGEAAAREAAGKSAAEIVSQAQDAALTLEHLDDEALRDLVARHIACIVPGSSRAG
jgi:vacuolar-type H+-ATPase subunit H